MSKSEMEAEISMLREKLSDQLAGGLQHRSDCDVYQAPAYEPTPCSCGVGTLAGRYKKLLEGILIQYSHRGCECTFPDDKCCAYAEAKAELALRTQP